MTMSERWGGFSDEVPRAPRGQPPQRPTALLVAILTFLALMVVLAALL
jgi:hypothetical protein